MNSGQRNANQDYLIKQEAHLMRQAQSTGQGSAAGSICNAAPPTRCFEIPERVERLHSNLNFLSEQVALLRDRLAPVLRPLPCGQKTEAGPAETGLGNELGLLQSKAELICAAINEMLEALEL